MVRSPDDDDLLWEETACPRECIKYTSLINIRPAAGNRGMEILDPALREKVREITFALIGEGEPI